MKPSEWRLYFGYHEPTPSQRLACVRIRTAVANLVDAYLTESHPGPEQTDNLRKLKDAQNAIIGHIVAGLPPDAFR